MKENYRLLCIIICVFLSSINGIACGKQAIIIFSADYNIKVDIYSPIDGAYNGMFVSDRLELKPHISIAYKLDVSNFCFIKLAYSNGMQYSLIIQENDIINAALDSKGITLNGSNARGNVYLNNFNRYANVDSIFDLHIKPRVDITAINVDLNKTFWKGFNADLDSLKTKEDVSSEFIRILSKDIGYAVEDIVVCDYHVILDGRKGEISPEDSVTIVSQIDSIYQEYPPHTNEAMKYRYLGATYQGKYYEERYNHLSLQAKTNFLQQHKPEVFGPYIPYLLAPDSILLPHIGSAFLIQFDYMLNEINKDKVLCYIEKKFPDSQYLQLMKKCLKEMNAKNEQPTENAFGLPTKTNLETDQRISKDSVIIINEEVNTLQELFSLDFLKGNRLYIDLWATWCLPCKAEFTYKTELHYVAKKNNIKLIYISIDEPRFKKKWEADIYGLNLAGYHLIVNDSLVKDIKDIIYKNKYISIPRYLFVNEKGEIINDNAPRPSEINEIEKMFTKNNASIEIER